MLVQQDRVSTFSTTEAPSIAITGIGAVSRMGLGVEPLLDALGDQPTVQNGLKPASETDTDLDVNKYVRLRTQCLDRVSATALIATSLALDDANWSTRGGEAGLILGTTLGNQSLVQTYCDEETLSPLRFVHSFINAPAGLVSQTFHLRGPHAVICSGKLAGLQSIRYALFLLRRAKATRIVCGGVDSTSAIGPTQSTRQEAAGVLALEVCENHSRSSTPSLYVLGSGAASDTIGSTLARALADAKVIGSEISDICFVRATTAEVYDEIEQCSQRFGLKHAHQVLVDADVGETGAADGVLALLATSAMASAKQDGSPKTIVICGIDEEQSIALVLQNRRSA